jgi:hypothetical protein
MKSNEHPDGPSLDDDQVDMVQGTARRWPRFLSDPAVRYALLLFLISRLVLTLWAVLITAIQPVPTQPNEIERPYLGAPILDQGPAGLLLGPWQRFDTMRYLRIAHQGYDEVEDSVFPPLYPLAINGLGRGLALLLPQDQAALLAAIIVSNVSFLATLIILHRLTAAETDANTARRTVIYFTLFPTAFFLVAAYSESLFIFLALACIWSARRSRFWLAGVLGLLAGLTRLTGLVLVVPLAFEYLRQRGLDWRHPRAFNWRALRFDALAVLLPLAGVAAFLVYRLIAGLPSIDHIYRLYWYQTTGLPGRDLLAAVNQMVAGSAAFHLYLDLFCFLLLIATTWIVFRRLGVTYGLYSATLLLFILLPTSEVKPLFSFSRYVLAFFPSFMVLGGLGRNPWVNRLIVYPSLALYLYLSGQFFMWGWVA